MRFKILLGLIPTLLLAPSFAAGVPDDMDDEMRAAIAASLETYQGGQDAALQRMLIEQARARKEAEDMRKALALSQEQAALDEARRLEEALAAEAEAKLAAELEAALALSMEKSPEEKRVDGIMEEIATARSGKVLPATNLLQFRRFEELTRTAISSENTATIESALIEVVAFAKARAMDELLNTKLETVIKALIQSLPTS